MYAKCSVMFTHLGTASKSASWCYFVYWVVGLSLDVFFFFLGWRRRDVFSDLCRLSTASSSKPSSSVASWISRVAFFPGSPKQNGGENDGRGAKEYQSFQSVAIVSVSASCCHFIGEETSKGRGGWDRLPLIGGALFTFAWCELTHPCAPGRRTAWCLRRRPTSSPTGESGCRRRRSCSDELCTSQTDNAIKFRCYSGQRQCLKKRNTSQKIFFKKRNRQVRLFLKDKVAIFLFFWGGGCK